MRGRSVVLWVDTFNNYFKPETSQAACDVLRHAGFSVWVSPETGLCCGRPLYDLACSRRPKHYLQRVMRVLRSVDAGLPVVVLEPSCASVFRDELRNLFPKDPRAHRLRSQTFSSQRVSASGHAPGYQPPQTVRKLLLHGHCHHKAIMKMGAEE